MSQWESCVEPNLKNMGKGELLIGNLALGESLLVEAFTHKGSGIVVKIHLTLQ